MDFSNLIKDMMGQAVDRPNKSTNGTLSGHAAGEPFEKCVYHILQGYYPGCIFKQHEFLNELYQRNPSHITAKQRYDLLNSPVALFLLSRGEKATREWSPTNIFEERQSDTADILFVDNAHYNIIDVKTRNVDKDAMPPNIISAYKLAKTCAIMIDNKEYNSVGIDYVEIEWKEQGVQLVAKSAHHGNLFMVDPAKLYINWAAGMQIQFHVCDMDQSWQGGMEEWARNYLRTFVHSAEERCKRLHDVYIAPFLKYLS